MMGAAMVRLIVLISASVLVGTASAQDEPKPIILEQSSRGWQLVRIPPTNSTRQRCEVRNPDGRIRFAVASLRIYYRGDSRSQNGQYRIDDGETIFYGNPTPVGPYFRSYTIEGYYFPRVMRGKRLRMESIIVGGGIEREDIDLANIKPLLAKLGAC